MCVYDTPENDRTQFTKRTLKSLSRTVDWTKHRLRIVDNNSCEATKDLYKSMANVFGLDADVIYLPENIGTAEAWNKGAMQRKPGEHVIKIDNDIIVHAHDWVEQLEECVERYPKLGQIGLKRKDLAECVDNPNPFYRSKLIQLPHAPGQRWIIIEAQFHVMGSCVLHTSRLLDTIGYMYQNGLYGFDDSYYSARAIRAKFVVAMLPHIDIDHIDTGGNPYIQQKADIAGELFNSGLYKKTLQDISEGKIYYDGIEHTLKPIP